MSCLWAVRLGIKLSLQRGGDDVHYALKGVNEVWVLGDIVCIVESVIVYFEKTDG